MARILVITWNFPPTVGGIENLMGEICTTLRSRHDVTVVTAGARTHEGEPGVIRLNSGNVIVFMIKSFFRSLSLLWTRHFDLVLAGSLLIDPIAVTCGFLTRTPVISMSYGLDIIYSHPLYQLWIRSFWNANRAVVAISENSKELLIRTGLSREKPFLINPGISRKFLQDMSRATPPADIREKFGIGDRPCLVSVGRLTKRKGIHPFVRDCLPRILKSIPDCVLLIVGDDPAHALVHKEGELAVTRKTVEEAGLGSSVIFAGKASDEDLMGIYGAGDLFIFPVVDVPNDVEGFGMVAIEAAVFGKPSVASRIGGIPDAVEDSTSGILVEPGDYEVFADSVLQLLEDPDHLNAVGQSARQRALALFNWDVLGERWETLIGQVLNKDRGSGS